MLFWIDKLCSETSRKLKKERNHHHNNNKKTIELNPILCDTTEKENEEFEVIE